MNLVDSSIFNKQKKYVPLLQVMMAAFALFLKTYFLFAGGWQSDRAESEDSTCAADSAPEKDGTTEILWKNMGCEIADRARQNHVQTDKKCDS